jgi:signal transduction histidine kinase
MRERVEQIGGTLTIHTGPDGTVITADLPLDVPA